MTSVQKIIKYFALAFAVFLIVSIASGILNVLYSIIGISDNKNNISTEKNSIRIQDENISSLRVELKYTKLIIKTDEYFHIESNNNKINCKQDNGKIEITEGGNSWFSSNNNGNLVIYMPSNYIFDDINIETGAGKVTIEELNTQKLSFSIGAGKVEINKLEVSQKANIEGGAGKLDITSGNINDLKLDMGVGQTNVKATILGTSELNSGIGNLNINLNSNKEDYKIKVSKGIGSIKIDSKETEDGQTFGNGDNYIEVEGGIGSINIEF